MQLTEQNAKEVIVDASEKKAVFVYFYMDVPECAPATKAITGAISDNNQYLSLVMADVSQPVGQAVAGQIGLRGVPALVIFKNGRPVDALQGEDIISKLSETIGKYMPSEADLLMSEAIEAHEKGDMATALTKASQSYKLDTKNLEHKFTLVSLYIKNRNFDKAHELLDEPGREEAEMQEYKDLVSALTLAEQAAESPEIKELQKAHQADPSNNEITQKLAAALSDAGKRKEALDLLFEILRKDLGNNDVKKTFLDILNTMSGDPLQNVYRRKLYALMY